MAKKAKAKMSKKAKGWLIGIGTAVLAVFMVGTITKLNKLDKTNEVSPTFGYEQGLISADGTEKKGTTSIRTKDFISVEGFKADLVSDPSVTYQLFFYDKDEKFIEASTELSADFTVTDENLPENAKYVRVMITPENDPEVSTSEISKYAGELEISYNKK